jgi:hypothetical protein
MISAELLIQLQSLSAADLTEMVNAKVRKPMRFESAKFVGITNGQQFKYNVTYTLSDELVQTAVFVTPYPSLTNYDIVVA